jgi:hypothetical protein
MLLFQLYLKKIEKNVLMWSKGVYVNKTMLINCLIISYKKTVVEKVTQSNVYVKVTQANLEMWSV